MVRCDFFGGLVYVLYQLVCKILFLFDNVKIWIGYDYLFDGLREFVLFVIVGEYCQKNKYLRDGVIEEEFVKMRKERDEYLVVLRLLYESLQVNVRVGRLLS